MPELPRWQDGEPANLPAAAADALEWLRLFALGIQARPGEGRARLARCLACLDRELTQPVATLVEYNQSS